MIRGQSHDIKGEKGRGRSAGDWKCVVLAAHAEEREGQVRANNKS